MSNIIQYDLFEEKPSEVDILRMEVRDVKISSDKVRKSLFAKNGELCKLYLDLLYRLDVLERGLCQRN